MLAKKNRLTREQFTHYFKTGHRTHSKFATLIVTKSDHFHGAVVVSKKVSKKAVTRNTLRRRAYAQLYQQFKTQNTGVYILLLKPTITSLNRKQQHQAIADLIAEVK